jgi:basic membrane lipoprotein Med (substrate-binding protein (PBP1-ABC) superfamily)
VTLGSVVIDVPHAFLLVAREVKAGTFRPRVVTFDSKSGVVELVVNPALESRVPTPVRARIDSIRALMRAGTFFRRVDP